jgi:hypothetical protein
VEPIEPQAARRWHDAVSGIRRSLRRVASTLLLRDHAGMAWHSRYPRLVALSTLALVIACADDGGGNDTGAVTTATSDGSATGTSGASTNTAATTAETSGTSVASSEEASTAAADSTTGSGEPVECGDAMCNPGEVCVVPCCGGPEPGCFEQPPDGNCGNGTPDPGGGSCCANDPDPDTCMMSDWCIPGPCIPDPVFCAPSEMISCVPEDPTNCSVRGGCFGDLLDGQLLCGGCK